MDMSNSEALGCRTSSTGRCIWNRSPIHRCRGCQGPGIHSGISSGGLPWKHALASAHTYAFKAYAGGFLPDHQRIAPHVSGDHHSQRHQGKYYPDRQRYFQRGCLLRVHGPMEAAIGFEPMHGGFAVHCLTTWLRRLSMGSNNTSGVNDGQARQVDMNTAQSTQSRPTQRPPGYSISPRGVSKVGSAWRRSLPR